MPQNRQGDRMEAAQGLRDSCTVADLPRLEELLTNPENDVRVGAASVILHLVAASHVKREGRTRSAD